MLASLGMALLSIGPNVGFVVAERFASSGVQAALKLLLGSTKAVLNGVVLVWAARQWVGAGDPSGAPDDLGGADNKVADRRRAWLSLSIVLQHVNTVLVPAATVLLLQPRCLLYATPLGSQTATVVSYSVTTCQQWTTTCVKRDTEGNCVRYDASCAAGGEQPETRFASVAYPWRWDTACPSTLLVLYGQVFSVALLVQCVMAAARVLAAVPSVSQRRRSFAERHCSRSPWCTWLLAGPRRSSGVREKARMYNTLEMIVIWGAFDARVAACGLLATLCLWLSFRLRRRLGVEFEDADVALPRLALALTIVSFCTICAFLLAGGDLLPRTLWWHGLLVPAGAAAVLLAGLHVGLRFCARPAPAFAQAERSLLMSHSSGALMADGGTLD